MKLHSATLISFAMAQGLVESLVPIRTPLDSGRRGPRMAAGGHGTAESHAPSILIVDPAGSLGLKALASLGFQVTTMSDVRDEELERALPGYEAVVVRSANRVTRQMMASNPRLAVVGRAGSGTDNIDLVAAAELGIPVVNAPSGNARSVAELVLGLMLSLARKIPLAHGTMQRGEWAKKSLVGTSLGGKTLGIIGFGSIGQQVARLAVAFGMNVITSLREGVSAASLGEGPKTGNNSYEVAAEVGVKWPPVQLDDLLTQSDFVTVHTPLSKQTRGLIGARELSLMKPSAFLINAARGGVVDERALLDCLQKGGIGGAAMDVFCSEKAPLEDHVIDLCSLEQVVCTPHIGASTAEAGDLVLSEVCAAVAEVFVRTKRLSQ
ncbi:unnamed protein product [Discosporangium mesarthrocarpum]